MKKENLWNVTRHKSRKTSEFIESLEPRLSWDRKQELRFRSEIAEALSKHEANEKLEYIGYNPQRKPDLYTRIDAIK